MTSRFRVHWAHGDEWHWLELDDDGYASRHVVVRDDVPVTAAAREGLDQVYERAGVLGVQVYEAFYGVLAEGVVEPPSHAILVTEDEFGRVFRRAVGHLNFQPVTTGPYPDGMRVEGVFKASAFPPGPPGAFVDLGGSVDGFVDFLWFAENRIAFPEPGTDATFEVVQTRPLTPQVRLRPIRGTSRDPNWPRFHDWSRA